MRVCRLSYPVSNAHAPYYIVICGLSGSTLFFQTISQRHDFRKKFIQHTVSVLTFSTSLSKTFLLLTIQRDTTKNVRRSSSTHYSCNILMKLEFPPQIFEKIQISDFMKIRPPGGELFHADGHMRS